LWLPPPKLKACRYGNVFDPCLFVYLFVC